MSERTSNARSYWPYRSTVWSGAIEPEKYGHIVDGFTSLFFCFGAIAVTFPGLAAGCSTGRWETGVPLGLRVFALSLLIAGACVVGGWVLGLIFGVPRALPPQSEVPQTASAAPAHSPTSKVNTNLQDISDWLTKIIVGVGLTQLNNFANIVNGYAWSVATGFGWGSYGHALAIGLFFYFLPGGFWLGYVGTRTIITLLFGAVDQLAFSPQQLDRAAQIKVDERGIEPADPVQKKVDETLLNQPLLQMTTPAEVKGWAAAQARQGNFQSARAAVQTVLTDYPKDADAADQLRAIQMGQMVKALYKAPPDGFNKAIEIGEELLEDPVAVKYANLHLWLACAYGQKYGFYKGKTLPPSSGDVQKLAVAEIEKTLRIDPGKRAFLYSLWRPAPDSHEDDLQSIEGLDWLASDKQVGEHLNSSPAGAS